MGNQWGIIDTKMDCAIHEAHHAGDIALKQCDVSPGDVEWERIPKGPLRYIVGCMQRWLLN